jgi:hypothetical protein
MPPPTSPRAVTAHVPRVGRQVRIASARFTCENHSREGGEGGVICETVPFDNGSSDRPQRTYFPRDETGLVCLPTQVERTLQLYW